MQDLKKFYFILFFARVVTGHIEPERRLENNTKIDQLMEI